MKASTHTEIYRPFEGELKRHPRRALILAWSAVRLGFRRKLPALLLFAFPTMSCIVQCFFVQLKFTRLPGLETDPLALAQAAMGQLVEVENLIRAYLNTVRWFALLAIAWYGSGLIAEDRRLGAHLLYFSRPLTRWQYVLGKFLAASFYGACALLFPVLVICSVASFSSPNWEFLTQKWDVILEAAALSSLWIATLTAIVLCTSSLVERKTLALSGVFAFVFLDEAASGVLAELTNESGYRLLSLSMNFERIGDWLFGRASDLGWDVEASFWVIGLLIATALGILWRRVRRMEVVA